MTMANCARVGIREGTRKSSCTGWRSKWHGASPSGRAAAASPSAHPFGTASRASVSLSPSASGLRAPLANGGLRASPGAARAARRVSPSRAPPVDIAFPFAEFVATALPKSVWGQRTALTRYAPAAARLSRSFATTENDARCARLSGLFVGDELSEREGETSPFDICCNGEPDDKPGSESSARVGVKPLEILR
jgi:hypothetical protein